ncbi:MAG: hypothetical protein LBL86_09430 [Coriobacteriales bacterium]|jgi:hypothetical protein|nr:hypothetical protein [Coriobacteriales bacterium]
MATEDYGMAGTGAGVPGTAADSGSGAGNDGGAVGRRPGAPDVRHALVYYLRSMGLATACFLGILVLLSLLFDLLILTTNVLELFDRSELQALPTFVAMLLTSSNVFLLVMGIVMQTYLETMLGFGLTRKQNSCALLLASALMALVLALVGALGFLLGGQFELLGSLQAFTGGWLSYLIGWFIVIGYQYRRVLAAALSTALGAALFWLVASYGSLLLVPLMMRIDALGREEASALAYGLSLLVGLALIPAILALARRIPLKV